STASSWRTATTVPAGAARRWIRSTKGSVSRLVSQSLWPTATSAAPRLHASERGRDRRSSPGSSESGNGAGGPRGGISGGDEVHRHGPRDEARGVAAVEQLLDRPPATLASLYSPLVAPTPSEDASRRG